MNKFEPVLACTALLLCGCGTVKDIAMTPYDVTHHVAVQTYRVATTPIRALRRHNDDSASAATTETAPQEATIDEQQTAPPPEVASAPQQRYEEPRETSSAETTDLTSRANRRETAEVKPKPSSQPRVASTQSEIPVAKAVPGKPGYVFSPFDASGRYVDVSGYQPGTKVKDPWTNKIFIVP